jgi:VanZ family protein
LKIRRAKIVLVAFVAFLVALVALADSGHGQQLFVLAKKFPAGDKIGHFVLFGTLSFLVNLILRATQTRLWGVTLLKGSAIVMSVVAVEEFSQLFLRFRSFDLGDLTADLIGVGLGGWLARKYLGWIRANAINTSPPGKTL